MNYEILRGKSQDATSAYKLMQEIGPVIYQFGPGWF